MAAGTVHFKYTTWVTRGNCQINIEIKAVETEDEKLQWTAKPISGKTLCYQQKYQGTLGESSGTYVGYYTFGDNYGIDFKLEINDESTNYVSGMAPMNSGITMDYSGWRSWRTTGKTVSMTTVLPYTDYTVKLYYKGAGGANSITVLNASTTPTVRPDADKIIFTNVKAKVEGEWLPANKLFAKDPEGIWQPVIAVYTKKEGLWRPV